MLKEFALELLKFIGELNYWHIALFSALESTCLPVIIPVETIIIPMGYYAYLGQKSLPILMFSATFGIVCGCVINYYFAKLLGRTLIYKYSKYLHINTDKLHKLEEKFLKHGRLLIFIGRFIPIPAFKHIITIPAGMAGMPIFQFIFYNMLGGFIFSTSMLLIGYFFGSSEALIHTALSNFTFVCLGIFGLYLLTKIVLKLIAKKKDAIIELANDDNQLLDALLAKNSTIEQFDDSVIKKNISKNINKVLRKKFNRKLLAKYSTIPTLQNQLSKKRKTSKSFRAFTARNIKLIHNQLSLANTKYSYAIKKVGKKAIKGTGKIVSGTAKTAKKSAIKTKRVIGKIKPKIKPKRRKRS